MLVWKCSQELSQDITSPHGRHDSSAPVNLFPDIISMHDVEEEVGLHRRLQTS